jgi:hypothetical protein
VPDTKVCASALHLRFEVAGQGQIQVTETSTPSITCPGTCEATYPRDTYLSLSAAASPGWVFNGWFGQLHNRDCGGTATNEAASNCSWRPNVLQPTDVIATFASTTRGIVQSTRRNEVAGRASLSDGDMDEAGRTLLAGNFEASIDFGAGNVRAVNARDDFVAAFDSAGAYLWMRHIVGGPIGRALFDGEGHVVATVHTSGSATVGGPAPSCMPSTGAQRALLVSYGATDGAYRWARCLEGLLFDVQVASGGALAVTRATNSALFVESYAASDGAPMASTSFAITATPQAAMPRASATLALGANGDRVLAGYLTGQIDLGNGPLVASRDDQIYVAKFASTGQLRFAKLLDPSILAARDVAITSRGEVALAGWYQDRITLGCSSFDAARDGNQYFASLDGTTGDVRWARSLFAQGVRMAAGDAFLISGGLLRGVNDLGPPRPLDYGNAYVAAKLDLDGHFVWMRLSDVGATTEVIRLGGSGSAFVANTTQDSTYSVKLAP